MCVLVVFTELAIQPSLNASLMPRYSTQNDTTNATDKAAAAGSSSNASPQSPSGMQQIHFMQLHFKSLAFQFSI